MVFTQTEEHLSFRLGDKVISSLPQLLDELAKLENKKYAENHITEDKNDYANWIRDVIGKADLADKVAETKNYKEVMKIIEDALDNAVNDGKNKNKDIFDMKPADENEDDIEKKESLQQIDDKINDIGSENNEDSIDEQKTKKGENNYKNNIESNNDSPVDKKDDKKSFLETENDKIKSLEKESLKGDEESEAESSVKESENESSSLGRESQKDTQKSSEESNENTDAESVNEHEMQNHHDILKKSGDSRYFCPKFFDCMRKEFLFGFGIGIIVGIVSILVFNRIL